MGKLITKLLAAFLLYPSLVLATYPGSIISSFFAKYIPNEGFPVGITYGNGYIWVAYAYDLVTKRRPDNGSIVASFKLESWGQELAWEESHKYIYNVGWFAGIYWSDSTTGSTVGSFPNPHGIRTLEGIEYDDSTPSRPIWVYDQLSQTVWNLTSVGSIVASFVIPATIEGLAYDADTAGGYYLFAGARSTPSYVFVVNARTLSIISSFVAPVADGGISDLSWDGRYLWALENGPPPAKPGWVYRFVAHSSPYVAPASLGKIKALYR
jgi:hypothetical protein